MLDPKLLRNDLKQVLAMLERRGVSFDHARYEQREQRRRILQVEVEQLKSQQKNLAKKIGIAKGKGEEARDLLTTAAEIKCHLEENEQTLQDVQGDLQTLLLGIPNLPHESVSDGKSEEDNVEVRTWGDKPTFSFEPKDHVDIAEALNLMDNPAAAQIAGARFSVLFGELAEMQRALTRFMLDVHVREHGYQEVYVPYIANADSLHGTGQLPKFEAELFRLDTAPALYLIPTAEVPLTNICRNRVLELNELPLKYVAHTPCFRSEAGSYGKDTRGILRQHQFEKVELVHIVRAADSWDTLEELTRNAEVILQRLDLPYRTVSLCIGDLGFSAAKTYDIEVWLPGQQCYREISSCSNMTNFQTRRMQIRTRNPRAKKPELVHSLNGSGLAVGRTLIAIIENGQDERGRVRIPSALIPYMNGKEIIGE